jgi:hypothetical protein
MSALRVLAFAASLGGIVAAVPALSPAAATTTTPVAVSAYRSPTCGCCEGWLDHLRQSGFTVKDYITSNLAAIKQRHGVPPQLQSCHTARIGGYTVEGHVPVSAIQRLLKERPQVAGIAVPGMPLGSPGMESPFKRESYTVFTFTESGRTQAFQTVQGDD